MATKKTTIAKTTAKAAPKKAAAKTTAKAAPKKAAAKKTTAKAAPKKAAAKKTTKKTTKVSASVKKANTALDKLNKMEVTLTIEELNRMVEHRAYDLYMERGYSHGDDMNDWLRAEQEIRSQYSVK